MSRRYRSEPIEVGKAPDGSPAHFRWRGRRYSVRVVVATWIEAVCWAETFRVEMLRVEMLRVEGASGQRHVWRVEAAARTGAVGVYDLSCTPHGANERWGLDRVFD
jgi:hypothetical protein